MGVNEQIIYEVEKLILQNLVLLDKGLDKFHVHSDTVIKYFNAYNCQTQKGLRHQSCDIYIGLNRIDTGFKLLRMGHK